MRRRYTVILIPDTEGGGYTVQVPTLPGCTTEGDTLQEALENAKDAIRLYVEDVIESGERVPEEAAAPLLEAVEV